MNNLESLNKEFFISKKIPVPINLITKYPRVINNIVLFWGDKEFIKYTDTLLLQNKSTLQQGFDLVSFNEITDLIEVHNNIYPTFVPKNKDPFSLF